MSPLDASPAATPAPPLPPPTKDPGGVWAGIKSQRLCLRAVADSALGLLEDLLGMQERKTLSEAISHGNRMFHLGVVAVVLGLLLLAL